MIKVKYLDGKYTPIHFKYTSTQMSSSSGILLVALAVGGAYLLISNANKHSVYRTPDGIVATSTTGIKATNFIKTNLGAATLQGIAWSRSDGTYEGANSYGEKLKEVYDETYGKGRW
jgi:hypothetical protein